MTIFVNLTGAVLLAAAMTSSASAGSFATIYKFDANVGENPSGRPIENSDGSLYGTTHFFGPGGSGAAYRLTPPAQGKTKWTLSVLYGFTDQEDGGGPIGGLVTDPTGALFGVTVVGGANDAGVVFMLTPQGESWTETVLYSFPSSDGYPASALLRDEAGNLYGTTSVSVFRLSPPQGGQGAWTETTLYTFAGGNDGAGLTGGLAGDSGGLYGTARSGGVADQGLVYSLVPPSSGDGPWIKTTLHEFSGADGSGPNGELLLRKGTLYGTTSHGGASYDGTVYMLKSPKQGHMAWKHTVLFSFSGPDGHLPYNGLAFGRNGALYGTTVEGGAFGKAGSGTVFVLTPPPKGEKVWSEQVLHSFANSDGNSPGTLLVDKTGTIYGGAQYGDGNNTGNLFRLLP